MCAEEMGRWSPRTGPRGWKEGSRLEQLEFTCHSADSTGHCLPVCTPLIPECKVSGETHPADLWSSCRVCQNPDSRRRG